MPLPEIRLSSLAYTVGHWLPRTYEGQMDKDPFDLNAPYQRGSVWTTEQRVALIKSLYMGLPTGAVIVSALPIRRGMSDYHYRVVDGKQRVETIRAFVADEFPIPYEWLRVEDRDSTGSALVAESGMVFHSETGIRFRRHFDMTTPFPALELKADTEFMGRDAAGKAIWRERTDAEILQVEAELYGLVNGGGTPQTAEDMARAASVASGGHPLR